MRSSRIDRTRYSSLQCLSTKAKTPHFQVKGKDCLSFWSHRTHGRATIILWDLPPLNCGRTLNQEDWHDNNATRPDTPQRNHKNHKQYQWRERSDPGACVCWEKNRSLKGSGKAGLHLENSLGANRSGENNRSWSHCGEADLYRKDHRPANYCGKRSIGSHLHWANHRESMQLLQMR